MPPLVATHGLPLTGLLAFALCALVAAAVAVPTTPTVQVVAVEDWPIGIIFP